MNCHSISNLLLGFTRSSAHASTLNMACVASASIHTSAAREKLDGADLSVIISDNILAAGIRYLKDDEEKLAENLRKRNAPVNFDHMSNTYETFKKCRYEINNYRHNRNVLTKGIEFGTTTTRIPSQGAENQPTPSADTAQAAASTGQTAASIGDSSNDGEDLATKGAEIKQSLRQLQKNFEVIKGDLLSQVSRIPNFTHPDVPQGGYDACRVVHTHGSKPEFSFPILDHVVIGEKHKLLDFSTPAVVTGRNFYYLKGAAALLELALIQFAMQKAVSKGYHPIMTPDIVKSDMVRGCGFNPRLDHTHLYKLLSHNKRLCLTGTAEIPLAGMLLNELLPLKKMPMRFVGFGRCFRAETGGSGQALRGLYRVHQFSKVELFSVTADETGQESEEMLQEMVDIEKEIAEELGFHYRVLEMSTGELGTPAYHKYDLEVWMPGKNEYGEVCSASNCTNFQSMRLRACYHNPAYNKDKRQPHKKFVHTVNATACAVPRLILALLENYQQEDGSVLLPKALHPFLPPDSWHIP